MEAFAQLECPGVMCFEATAGILLQLQNRGRGPLQSQSADVDAESLVRDQVERLGGAPRPDLHLLPCVRRASSALRSLSASSAFLLFHS
jgi:hypothetical protein